MLGRTVRVRPFFRPVRVGRGPLPRGRRRAGRHELLRGLHGIAAPSPSDVASRRPGSPPGRRRIARSWAWPPARATPPQTRRLRLRPQIPLTRSTTGGRGQRPTQRLPTDVCRCEDRLPRRLRRGGVAVALTQRELRRRTSGGVRLGRAVRELRERHGWSQTQLANAASMTRSAVAPL